MTLIKRSFPTLGLSDFFNNDWLSNFPNGDWMPAINVIDEADKYFIEVAAPGIGKDDFKVNVDNGILSISGESTKEEEEKDKNYTRKEFSSKSFSRAFTLPTNVNADDIKANYKDGVLSVTLMKTEIEEFKKKEVSID